MTIGERIQKSRKHSKQPSQALPEANPFLLGFSDTGSTPVYSIAFGKIETAQKLHIAKTHAENAKEPPESGNVHNLEAVFVVISIERTTGPSNRTPAAHPSGGKQYERLSAFGV